MGSERWKSSVPYREWPEREEPQEPSPRLLCEPPTTSAGTNDCCCCWAQVTSLGGVWLRARFAGRRSWVCGSPHRCCTPWQSSLPDNNILVFQASLQSASASSDVHITSTHLHASDLIAAPTRFSPAFPLRKLVTRPTQLLRVHWRLPREQYFPIEQPTSNRREASPLNALLAESWFAGRCR